MGSQSDWRGPKPARNSLARKTTEEGKSYQRYTYLGGDSKASLPASERAKMVVHLFQDQITMVRAQQWSSDTLDAIIFMATRAQPTTKLHCLSIDPIQLREMLSREFSVRKARDCDADLLDSIIQAGDNQDQLIAKAQSLGFSKFDPENIKMSRVGAINPRGREPTDMADKLRQAEMAKAEAKNQREAAQLEFEIAQLQRKKAEETERLEATRARILTASSSTPRATFSRTPTKDTSPHHQPGSTGPKTPDRTEAIAQALADRTARLGPLGGSRSEPTSATGNTPKATQQLGKAPQQPVAAKITTQPAGARGPAVVATKPPGGLPKSATSQPPPAKKSRSTGGESQAVVVSAPSSNPKPASQRKEDHKAITPTQPAEATEKSLPARSASNISSGLSSATAGSGMAHQQPAKTPQAPSVAKLTPPSKGAQQPSSAQKPTTKAPAAQSGPAAPAGAIALAAGIKRAASSVSDTAAASAAKRTRSPGHETNLAPSRIDDNSHQGEVKHKAIPKVSEPKIAHLDRDDVGHGHITEPPQDTTQEEDNGKVHVDVDLEAPEVAAGDEAVEDKGHSEDCAAEGEVPETDQPQASGDGEHLEDDKASQADENQGDNENVAGSAAEDEAPAASEDEGQAKDDSQAAGEDGAEGEAEGDEAEGLPATDNEDQGNGEEEAAPDTDADDGSVANAGLEAAHGQEDQE